MNQNVRGIGAFRTMYMTPFSISGVVNCLIWGMLLAKSNGVINGLLNTLNLPSQGFWSDKNQAIWCIVAESTWAGAGYWIIFFLSGLKGIDTSVYESAALDGCRFFRRLFSIYFADDETHHSIRSGSQYHCESFAVYTNENYHKRRPYGLNKRIDVRSLQIFIYI